MGLDPVTIAALAGLAGTGIQAYQGEQARRTAEAQAQRMREIAEMILRGDIGTADLKRGAQAQAQEAVRILGNLAAARGLYGSSFQLTAESQALQDILARLSEAIANLKTQQIGAATGTLGQLAGLYANMAAQPIDLSWLQGIGQYYAVQQLQRSRSGGTK